LPPIKSPILAAIQNLQLLNLKKTTVFLHDVASIKLEPAVETITRINQKRTVLLSASVTKDNLPATVVRRLSKKGSQ